MTKKIVYFIIFAVISTFTIGCNSSSNDDPLQIPTSQSAAIVTSFKFTKNNKVVQGLDSVFFSIDLDRCLVFNADSLPYGTRTDKLVPVIGAPGCSVVEITVKRAGLPDTTYNYLAHSTDTIDFSQGPAKLHLVAADGITTRDFEIHVNVHQMKADELYWNRAARRDLPSTFGVPTRQRTAQRGEMLYCLTSNGSEYCMATATHPNTDWVTRSVTFPFEPIVETFNATTDALYILDSDRVLWSSTDGSQWTSTGQTLYSVYGGYRDQLVGVVEDGGAYYHLLYPSMLRAEVPSGCPVSGVNQLVTFDNKWADAPQAFVVGGRDASGSLTGDMWGFDGRDWAKISLNSTPAGENKIFFSYTTFVTDSANLTAKAFPTLFCMGGRDANRTLLTDVYVSLDMGLNWHKGDDLVQLPTYMPAMAEAQVYVYPTTLYASRDYTGWTEMPSKGLPAWYEIYRPMSRAIEPITQWECPYLYMFGGVSYEGTLYNTMWRGVINRLSFRPLQ